METFVGVCLKVSDDETIRDARLGPHLYVFYYSPEGTDQTYSYFFGERSGVEFEKLSESKGNGNFSLVEIKITVESKCKVDSKRFDEDNFLKVLVTPPHDKTWTPGHRYMMYR